MSYWAAVWMVVIGAIGVFVLGTALTVGIGRDRLGGGRSLAVSNCEPTATSGTVVNVTLSDRGAG